MLRVGHDDIIAILAALSGVLAVLLTARQNIWCWPIGILNTVLSAYVYFFQQLQAEALLQFFYMAMAIFGWWKWAKGDKSPHGKLAVSNAGACLNGILITLGALVSLISGYFFMQINQSGIAFIDAGLTSFSLVANYLAARKKIDSWIYWIVINIASIGLYLYKDLYSFALLFLFYILIALRGYVEWRSELKTL